MVAGQVMSALGRAAEAQRVVADGLAWVKHVHDSHVPGEFRDSFRQRNSVNRELFALAARWATAG